MKYSIKTENKRIYLALSGILNMRLTKYDLQTRVDVKLIWNSKCILDITGFPVQVTFNQMSKFIYMLGIFSRE